MGRNVKKGKVLIVGLCLFSAFTIVAYATPDSLLVKTSVSGIQESVFYTIRWDGVDDRGQKVGGGIYILRMETPAYHATKKFVLLR